MRQESTYEVKLMRHLHQIILNTYLISFLGVAVLAETVFMHFLANAVQFHPFTTPYPAAQSSRPAPSEAPT